MRHVEQIAVRPHAIGMADHDRVRDYVVAQLTALGLHPQVQPTTGDRHALSGGRARPEHPRVDSRAATPNGKAVLLMAHYDGVEAGPAASDDGAGSAALLETVRALRARKTPLAHDVIVLFTDGEEAGLLGAAAFVREHPWAKDVAVVVNFEARGTSGPIVHVRDRSRKSRRRARACASAGDVDRRLGVHHGVSRAPERHRSLRARGARTAGAQLRVRRRRRAVSHEPRRRRAPRIREAFSTTARRCSRSRACSAASRCRARERATRCSSICRWLGLVIYPEAFAMPLAIVALVLGRRRRVSRPRTASSSGVATTLVAVVAVAGRRPRAGVARSPRCTRICRGAAIRSGAGRTVQPSRSRASPSRLRLRSIGIALDARARNVRSAR